MVPITVSVVIGGIVYGIVMGAITGYFSAAIGMLFVIAGIIGIISAAFPGRKALAVFVKHISICPIIKLLLLLSLFLFYFSIFYFILFYF